MANEIKDKFSSSAALTITLASLADSATVGRQSTIVDNSSTRYGRILVFYKITLGTSPTGSRPVFFYFIHDDADGSPHRDGAAGASDAGWTAPEGMIPVWAERDKVSPSTGDVLQGSFVVDVPGPKWGIGVVQNSGVALNSTGGNHWVRWIGINPEVQ